MITVGCFSPNSTSNLTNIIILRSVSSTAIFLNPADGPCLITVEFLDDEVCRFEQRIISDMTFVFFQKTLENSFHDF